MNDLFSETKKLNNFYSLKMVNKENIICVESVKTKEFYAVKFFSARELGLNIQITNAWTCKPSMTFSIAKFFGNL